MSLLSLCIWLLSINTVGGERVSSDSSLSDVLYNSTVWGSSVAEHRRKLQRIRVVGRDPAGKLLPLGRCRGDCDSDRDVSQRGPCGLLLAITTTG